MGVIGVGHLHPYPLFEDLRQVTSTADCVSADPHWSPVDATCDPWGRAYNYPMIWARLFSWLGLGQSDTNAIGYSFVALYVLFALLIGRLVLKRVGGAGALLVNLTLVSPPALLLVERGNVDIVVLLMTAAFVAAVATGRSRLGVGLLTVAAALKIFPAAAGLGFLALRARPRLILGLAAVLTLLAFGLELPDLVRAAQRRRRVQWLHSALRSGRSWSTTLILPARVPAAGRVGPPGSDHGRTVVARLLWTAGWRHLWVGRKASRRGGQ